MLEGLFGSKNIEKILLFLFVNGKCYGTQLHRNLRTPLTPIQKGLIRLEKSGVIMSYYEGKTRVYQFNPAFPLLEEMEILLKKAYTLLPSHTKRNYYVAKEDKTSFISQKNQMHLLILFWNQLGVVKHISFYAKSRAKEEQGWNGTGKGEVVISKQGDNILIFNEKGNWHGKNGASTGFTNVFRWTLDRTAGLISLEHLRFGVDHPVFLFHLEPSNQNTLSSVDSHFCEGDTYFGQISMDHHSLRLNWRVIGPKKNEELDYYYTP